jgi:hypothetical protein
MSFKLFPIPFGLIYKVLWMAGSLQAPHLFYGQILYKVEGHLGVRLLKLPKVY